MAFQYILRKYKLPKGYETRYQALQAFKELPDKDSALVDEFAVSDQPKRRGWFGAAISQVLG